MIMFLAVVTIISLESLILVIYGEVKEATASRGKERIRHLAILPPYGRQIRLVLLEPLLSVFFMLGIHILNPLDILLFTTIVASQNPSCITKEEDFAQFIKTLNQSFNIIGSNAE